MFITINYYGSLVTTLVSNRKSKSSRGFSLVWLLAFKESFAGLVCRVVSLFTPRGLFTSHANDFINATCKSHAREKKVLAGQLTAVGILFQNNHLHFSLTTPNTL